MFPLKVLIGTSARWPMYTSTHRHTDVTHTHHSAEWGFCHRHLTAILGGSRACLPHGSWDKDMWPNLGTHEDIEKWGLRRSCCYSNNPRSQGEQGGQPADPCPCLTVRPGKRRVQCLTAVVAALLSSAGPWCHLCTSRYLVSILAQTAFPAFPGSWRLPNIYSKRPIFCNLQLKHSFPKSDQQNFNVSSRLSEWIHKNQNP